jgi:hypothetical protein
LLIVDRTGVKTWQKEGNIDFWQLDSSILFSGNPMAAIVINCPFS